MADTVLDAFERYDEIDMIVVLPHFTGLTPAAALDLKALKAGIMSLGKAGDMRLLSLRSGHAR